MSSNEAFWKGTVLTWSCLLLYLLLFSNIRRECLICQDSHLNRNFLTMFLGTGVESENNELQWGEKLLGVLKSSLIFSLPTEVCMETPVESHAVVKKRQRAPRCDLPISPTQSLAAPPGCCRRRPPLTFSSFPILIVLLCGRASLASYQLQSFQFVIANTLRLSFQLLPGGGLVPALDRQDVN